MVPSAEVRKDNAGSRSNTMNLRSVALNTVALDTEIVVTTQIIIVQKN